MRSKAGQTYTDAARKITVKTLTDSGQDRVDPGVCRQRARCR